MKTSSSKPTVTKKFPIEVPTHEYYSTPCVYKVYFGKKYIIWKGKSLLQSVQQMAEVIERALRLGWDDDTNYFYHVWTYIKKARVMRGTVERLHDDFKADNLALLKFEQDRLDESYSDENCLNNNTVAYTPAWMGEAIEKEFNQWIKKRKCNRKK